MNKITILTFILGSIPLVFGQVLNLDRENGDDTVFHRNIINLNFGFSLDKQKRDLIEFSSQLENDFFSRKIAWFGLHSRKPMRRSMVGQFSKTMGICKCG